MPVHRRYRARIRALAILIAAAILATAFVLFARSDFVAELVRDRLIVTLRALSGREVDIDAVAVRFRPPGIAVLGLSVAGAGGPDRPLLSARESVVDLALLPILAGDWIPKSVVVDGLDVHWAGGETLDLPDRGRAEPGARVAIPQVTLRNGRFSWGGGSTALAFEAADLEAAARPVPCAETGCFDGTLSGTSVSMSFGERRLSGSSLRLALRGRGGSIAVEDLVVEGADLRIGGGAVWTFGAAEPGAAGGAGRGDESALQRGGGALDAEASLTAGQSATESLIGSLPLRAERLEARSEIDFEAGRLGVRGTATLHAPRWADLASADRLQATFNKDGEGAVLEAEAAGLSIRAGGLRPTRTGAGRGRLAVTPGGEAEGTFSIDPILYRDALRPFNADLPIADVTVRGEGEVRLDAKSGRVLDGVLRLDVEPAPAPAGTATRAAAGATERPRVEMTGRAAIDIGPEVLRLREGRLTSAEIEAGLAGTIRPASSSAEIDVTLERVDLPRLLAALPGHPAAAAIARASEGGSASGALRLSIRPRSIGAAGRIDARGLTFPIDGEDAAPFDASLEGSLRGGDLVLDRIDLRGAGWSAEGGIRIGLGGGVAPRSARLALTDVPASPLWSLVGIGWIEGGAVSGTLAIEPGGGAAREGESAVDLVLKDARAAGVAIDRAAIRGAGTADILKIDSLVVESGEARADAGGTWEIARSRVTLDITADDLDAALLGDRLDAVPGGARGRFSASGALALAPGAGRFEGSGRGADVAIGGVPIGVIDLPAIVWDTAADPAITVRFDAPAVRASGDAAWSPATGVEARIAFDATPLDPFRALLAETPAAEMRGSLSASLIARVPDGDVRAASLDLDVGSSEVTVGSVRLQSSEPARLTYDDGRWRLDRLHAVGTGTDLVLSALYDTRDGAPATGSLTGRFDAGLLSLMWPDLVAQGSVDMEISATARGRSLDYGGEMRASLAALGYEGLPLAADRLDLAATIRPDGTVVIDRLKAEVAGGSVNGGGRCALSGLAMESCALELTGKDLSMQPVPDLLVFFDGNIRLIVNEESASLAGRVAVLRALYTMKHEASFATLLGAEQASLPSGAAPAPFPLNLDLEIEAPSEVWVRSPIATLEGAARLKINGTADRPRVLGRITVFEGGRIRFRDVSYTSEEGSIDFDSPDEPDPSLNLSATTQVGDYEVRLRVLGRASDPRIELSSDPPLSSRDIVSLLLTGSTFEQSFEEGAGATLLAEEQVGQYLTMPISKALGKVVAEPFGLTSVQLDPQFLKSSANPTARLTITKRLSPDLMLTFSNDLGSSQAQIYQFEYRIGRHWQFIGLRDLDQTVSGNIAFRHRWGRSDRAREEREAEVYGPQPRGSISRVRIEGNPLGEEVALRKRIPLKEGAEFARAEALEGREALREFLVRSGYPLAVVRLRYEEPGEGAGDADGSPLTVLYEIDPGPHVSLRIASPDHRKAMRGAVLEEWNAILRAGDLEPSGEEAIRRRLEEMGHAAPRIEGQVRDEGERLGIDYRVAPGPKIAIRSIRFSGADALDEEVLRAAMASREDRWNTFGIYRPTVLEEDAGRIADLYRERGYLDVRVAEPIVEPAARPREVEVTIPIEEGGRTDVREVAIEGARTFPTERLVEVAALPAGSPVTPSGIAAAEKRLREFLDGEGFREASVRARLDRTEKGAGVTFEVEEGPRQFVEGIRISGDRSTERRVIAREVILKPGEPLSGRKMIETQRNLYARGLFDSVDVEAVTLPDDPERAFVDVRVEEGRPWLTAVGAGYDSEEKILGSFLLGHKNLFGTGRSASLFLRGSSLNRRSRFSLFDHRLFGTRSEGVLTAFFEEQEKESFDERRRGIGLRVSRKLSPRLTLLGQYSIQDSDLLRVDAMLPPDVDIVEGNLRLAYAGAALARDTRDDLLGPSKGSFLSADVRYYGQAVGSDAEFTRFFLAANTFRSLSERVVLAGSARIGYARPFGVSSDIPLAERFFAGGDTTLRGFDRDLAGPLDPATLEPVGGELSLLFNAELRYPIYRRIGGTFFYDAGNVFLRPEVFRTSGTEVIVESGCAVAVQDGLRHVLGAGIVWRTPIGPIRVEYGRKLNRREGTIDFTGCMPDGTPFAGSVLRDESPGQFFLSIGHAF